MKGKDTACTVLSGVLARVGDELCTGRACNGILQLLLYGLMVREEPETSARCRIHKAQTSTQSARAAAPSLLGKLLHLGICSCKLVALRSCQSPANCTRQAVSTVNTGFSRVCSKAEFSPLISNI